jgi:hypothetical protein
MLWCKRAPKGVFQSDESYWYAVTFVGKHDMRKDKKFEKRYNQYIKIP